MKVVVVGAGVMGCATALALAERGVDVVLLERMTPGAEASGAAAGILGAQMEYDRAEARVQHEAHLPLFVRARAGYADWAGALRRVTGIDVGYRAGGVLSVARTEEEHAELVEAVAWQAARGLRAEMLEARDARALEPELAPGVVSAAHYPDDAQVEPPLLVRALVVACARAGVELRTGVHVHRLLLERDVCTGVALDEGPLHAGAIVLAAGSWSSLVPGVPTSLPAVRPARGQIVQLDERPPRLRTIVLGGGAYAVPRGDGRVVCGSTLEFVGYQKEVTAGGVREILTRVTGAVPCLAEASVASMWSGLRPCSVGGEPLVGRSPMPGLFVATGHFRNGILLAKVTADAVADAILGDPESRSRQQLH